MTLLEFLQREMSVDDGDMLDLSLAVLSGEGVTGAFELIWNGALHAAATQCADAGYPDLAHDILKFKEPL